MSRIYPAATVMLLSIVLLLLRRRGVDRALYSPELAWLRGFAWFGFCLSVALAWGYPLYMITDAILPPGGSYSGEWIFWTLLVTAQLVFGYFWYWPRGTTSHGRPLRTGWSLGFGLLWGFCQSLMLLTGVLYVASAFYALFPSLNDGSPLIGIAVFVVVYSVFMGTWQALYWDRHVSPAHNIREWNARKVLFVHLPFLVLTLWHLASFGSLGLFVIWHTLALVAASWTMRFPSPLDPPTPAHDPQGVPMASLSGR